MTTDLESRLRQAALDWPVEETRLLRVLSMGRLCRSVARGFALGCYSAAVRFKRDLLFLAAITPDQNVRALLLANILEEEGMTFDDSGKIERNIELDHVEWARRLTRAAGVGDSDLPAVPDRTRTDWLSQAIDERRWLEGMAYLLVGMEFNVPRTFRLAREALGKLGYRDEDLTFLTNHITADERHGSTALQLVAQKASLLEDPQPIVQAVKRGAEAFCRSYGGLIGEGRRR